MSASYLKEPLPLTELGLKSLPATCTLRVIDSTARIVIGTGVFVDPVIEGYEAFDCPAYSFLITHQPSGRHFLFDLGVRKDWENAPPTVVAAMKQICKKLEISKNVSDILAEDTVVGVKPEDVEAVIWSHHHFDHVGDMGLFPKSTGLIVGPGFKGKYLPAYPENPESSIWASDFEGREVREVDIEKEGKGLKVGSCKAMDFFGDGSMLLLDTPGHTTGHLCALIKTTSAPDTYVLLGGDVSHHGGEFKPSEWLPLPKTVTPTPMPKFFPHGCPGDLLVKIKERKGVDTPFYEVKQGATEDAELASRSIHHVQEIDAHDNIFTIIAHDQALYDQLPYFPETINDWYAKDLDRKTRWKFTEDFAFALEKVAQ